MPTFLVCPELIPPSDWLPLIWNRDGGDDTVYTAVKIRPAAWLALMTADRRTAEA